FIAGDDRRPVAGDEMLEIEGFEGWRDASGIMDSESLKKQEVGSVQSSQVGSVQSSQTNNSEVSKKYVGISILKQMEDTINVGMALGYNMEGCQDTLSRIIADMGDERVIK
ncbi:hypothetical protein Tco_1169181, partial [Tanacetum coccineum]